MALKMGTEFKDIAEKIINKYITTFANIEIDQILFLVEDEKAPKKYADIRIVKPPYTFITNYKFIMTIYEPTIISMNDAQKNILVMHELMHIDSDFEKLVKHNIEDFSEILSIYGVDWDTNPNTKDPLEEGEEDE